MAFIFVKRSFFCVSRDNFLELIEDGTTLRRELVCSQRAVSVQNMLHIS